MNRCLAGLYLLPNCLETVCAAKRHVYAGVVLMDAEAMMFACWLRRQALGNMPRSQEMFCVPVCGAIRDVSSKIVFLTQAWVLMTSEGFWADF